MTEGNLFQRLPGTARRFIDLVTGQEVSRRQQMKAQRAAGVPVTSTETTRDKVQRALYRVTSLGESKTKAAEQVGVSPEAAKRDPRWGQVSYNRQTRRGELHAAGSTSFFDAEGALHRDVFFDRDTLGFMSAYGGALKAAKAGRGAGLATFAGLTVRDVYGNEYTLLTDINAYQVQQRVYGIGDPMDYFKSGDEVVTPAGAGGNGGRVAA